MSLLQSCFLNFGKFDTGHRSVRYDHALLTVIKKLSVTSVSPILVEGPVNVIIIPLCQLALLAVCVNWLCWQWSSLENCLRSLERNLKKNPKTLWQRDTNESSEDLKKATRSGDGLRYHLGCHEKPGLVFFTRMARTKTSASTSAVTQSTRDRKHPFLSAIFWQQTSARAWWPSSSSLELPSSCRHSLMVIFLALILALYM